MSNEYNINLENPNGLSLYDSSSNRLIHPVSHKGNISFCMENNFENTTILSAAQLSTGLYQANTVVDYGKKSYYTNCLIFGTTNSSSQIDIMTSINNNDYFRVKKIQPILNTNDSKYHFSTHCNVARFIALGNSSGGHITTVTAILTKLRT
tara:strand:+ start:17389 stop:17841 length:453 start_codon:yes stop_codon:yes gene_type:complete